MYVRRKHTKKETEEMNITAFMNLMVILVPFLLITAVFSKIAILELNIPKGDAAANGQQKPELQLQIVIRKDFIDVQDGVVGLIKRFPLKGEETSWQTMTDLLLQLKNKFPDKQSVTLLIEPDISYQVMVKVMDRARVANVIQPGMTVESVELFPAISIGDAPVTEAGAGK